MAKVMRTDISEIMKARVLCGYGVDSVSRELVTPSHTFDLFSR
jgi:hypothetical protein